MKILKLFVLAVMLAVPAMASTADPLPEGFIAVSESNMTWADAKAWCQQHGGKLPLIGGSDSLTRADVDQGPPIDGFGVRGAPWPPGLPSDYYWTGAENDADPGRSWVVYDFDGKVGVASGPQSRGHRVFCVP